jgi:hypothetical protein
MGAAADPGTAPVGAATTVLKRRTVAVCGAVIAGFTVLAFTVAAGGLDAWDSQGHHWAVTHRGGSARPARRGATGSPRPAGMRSRPGTPRRRRSRTG